MLCMVWISLIGNVLLIFVCRCWIVILMMLVLLLKFMFYMYDVICVWFSILFWWCVSSCSSENFCGVRLICVVLCFMWWCIMLMFRLLIVRCLVLCGGL